MKRKVMGLLMAVLILTNSVPVFASAQTCAPGEHTPLVLYRKELVAQTKTGEHVVSINGKQAICFIYTESYNLTYYCQSCGTYLYSTINVPNVHSLGK